MSAQLGGRQPTPAERSSNGSCWSRRALELSRHRGAHDAEYVECQDVWSSGTRLDSGTAGGWSTMVGPGWVLDLAATVGVLAGVVTSL